MTVRHGCDVLALVVRVDGPAGAWELDVHATGRPDRLAGLALVSAADWLAARGAAPGDHLIRVQSVEGVPQ